MPTRLATTYGAKLDGTTDDSAALQAWADALLPGDVGRLTSGRRPRKTRVTRRILLRRPFARYWFDDHLVIPDNPAYPDNSPIVVESPEVGGGVPFAGTIAAGELALPVAGPAFVALGTDPLDANQPHCTMIATEGRVHVPYDINGTRHSVTPLQWVTENVEVRGLNFADGNNVDCNLTLRRCRNATVSGLAGTVAIGVSLEDAENVTIDDVDVTTVKRHGAGGRVLSAWGSKRVQASRLRWATERSGGVFLENWCRDVCLEGLDVTVARGELDWYDTNSTPVVFYRGVLGLAVRDVHVRTAGLRYDFDVGGALPEGVEQPAPVRSGWAWE